MLNRDISTILFLPSCYLRFVDFEVVLGVVIGNI